MDNSIGDRDVETIGRYRMIKKLGEGGMGEVWLAEHSGLHAFFAVKKAYGDSDSVPRKCLRIEAERMKGLSNRRIPYPVDILEEENSTVLVMEYIEGVTLEEYIRKNAPLEEEEAIAVFKQICEILAYLHSRSPQIIYRDIKPSNFMISSDGEIRLLDFGAAVIADGKRSDEVYGTEGYAAPEQLKGRGIRSEADIYSAAAVFSYMLSAADPSHPPFHPVKGRELGRFISRSSIKLIDCCLSEDPDQRPSNGEALLELVTGIRPGKELVFEQIKGHLYRLFMWLMVAAGCVMLLLRYGGESHPVFEMIVILLSVAGLLWGIIRDELFEEKGFILQRSWNIMITEKKNRGIGED